MTTERFNELLNGPLSHPLPMFAVTRLVLALAAVVRATGDAGDKALEDYCASREAQDRRADDPDLATDLTTEELENLDAEYSKLSLSIFRRQSTPRSFSSPMICMVAAHGAVDETGS